MEKTTIDMEHSRMTRSAGVVSVAVMCSRVLGLVREMVLASLFDVRKSLDPFYVAYTIPNLLRDLFAEGALNKAFVATFTDVDAKSGDKAAWQLANLVFSTFTVILTVITVIGIVFTPFIVGFILRGKGFDTALPPDLSFGFADKRELTIYLTRIMFPFLLLVSLAAISMGLLNSKGRFGVPASASSFFNIGSIIVGVWGYYLAPKFGQHPLVGIAVGILTGGALQFVVQIPSMWRVGYRYRPILSFTDPNLRRVMRLVAPAVLGAAAMQINVVFNRLFFASQGDGWFGWNYLAFRLMHLPMGVLGVAISTALLPLLSQRVATQKTMDEYRETFSYALKLTFILTLPASAGLIALNKPMVALLYQRGEFSAYDTQQVAGALFCYGFGLFGYSGVKIATDGFYALKNIRTPVIVSLFTIGLNIILNYVLIFQLGVDHRSLAISTSCSVTVNFIAVLWLLRRRVGNFGGHGASSAFVRSLIATVGMGAAAWLTYRQLLSLMGDGLSLLTKFITLLAPIIIAVPVYYGLCRALKLREVDEIIGALVEKFGK
jgi:putative peptidoglycan lipid II flippase